jgi:isoquinoline 1-oxidoreductase
VSAALELDRREFLRIFGGGIVVTFALGPETLLAQRGGGYPTDWHAYLKIGEDGRVSVFSGKIEMGQGVTTSLAQMAAEELGVGLESIDMIMGDTDVCVWDAGTYGSLTTRMFGPALRAAAAEAKAVLMQLAAERLGVPKAQLTAGNGNVWVTDQKTRSVSYAELAKGQALARKLDEKAVLRSVKEFQTMGRSPLRVDGKDKVTGAAKYAADVRLPGMLYAKVLRPPAHGAKLVKADTANAAKASGVTLVNEDAMIAVLHENPESAERALALITAEWTTPEPGADQEGIFDELLRKAPDPETFETRGDTTAARSAAAKLVEHTYHKGYVAHAPMEPHAAIAEIKDGKATIWASTQTPFPTRDRLAQVLGMDAKSVRVITPYVGGGFGGKSAGRQAEEAATLAKITGKPVQVAWTRAEEFFYDTFDPASIARVASAVDSTGKIAFWEYDVYFAGGRGAEFFYDVPNVKSRFFGGWRGAGSQSHRFGVGPWRGPGANMNIWVRESHVDALAADAGLDPLEFRLRNLKDARMRGVLEAAAVKFGWKPAKAPSGRGFGIACGVDAGTYVALIAEVQVDRKAGGVKVERVVCAEDMGIVVNPEGATQQAEGSIMMGLGYVLTEELRFSGGRILDENFDSYELPRFSWAPQIEVVFVKHDDLDPQGGGEPAIVPMGGAIANAVFDATGKRVTRLPITRERLRAALV